MNKIKIGWSEVSIVPEGRRVDLVGQFYERISGEIETPIAVTALALECGDDQMIFVACDLVSTSYKLLEAVREECARELYGEFQRKFDLVRWGIWYERTCEHNNSAYIMDYIQPYHKYYPIPSDQVEYSGGALDNKEYTGR